MEVKFPASVVALFANAGRAAGVFQNPGSEPIRLAVISAVLLSAIVVVG